MSDDVPNDDGPAPEPQPGGEAPPPWANDLRGSVGELTGTIKALLEEARAARAGNQPAPTEPEEDEPEIPDQDLDLMSRADFGKHIVAQMLKAVNKQVVEPLNQQLAAVTAATTRRDIVSAVAELRSKHKDFNDWTGDMIELAKQNPGLPPHRLYQLARADNPTRAAELDAKYNPRPSTGKIRIRGFGGMTPSQSGTASKGGKMNGTEAANVAWADTVAALGGEPFFEE